MGTSRAVAIAVGLALAFGVAAPACASSIVFVKDWNVWIANPDGSGARQLTTDGTSAAAYEHPTQADDGTILATRLTRFHLLRRDGTAVRPPLDSVLTQAAPGAACVSTESSGGRTAVPSRRRSWNRVRRVARIVPSSACVGCS